MTKTKEKLDFTLDNIAYVKKQKVVDKIVDLNSFYDRYRALTIAQEAFLDSLVEQVKEARAREGSCQF